MATTAEQKLGMGHAHRVCFIDDSRTSAFVTKKLLKQFGYEVDHFPAAEAAIDAIMERDYSALITDLMISSDGGVNGDDLIRLVRHCGHPTKSKMPILVVTGSASSDSHQSLLQTGANAVLLKPLDGPELDRELKSAIQQAAKTGVAPTARSVATPAPTPTKFSATYFAELPVESEPTRPTIEPLIAIQPRAASIAAPESIPTLTQTVARELHKPPQEPPKRVAGGKERVEKRPNFDNLTLQEIAAQSESPDADVSPPISFAKPAPQEPTPPAEEVRPVRARQETQEAPDREKAPRGKSAAAPAEVAARKPESTPKAKRDPNDDALLSLLNQLDDSKLKGGSSAAPSPFAAPRRSIQLSPTMKKVMVGVALIALLVPAVYFVVNSEPTPQIALVAVTQGSVSASIKTSGKVVSRRKIALTPYYAGQVAKINVKEGDQVKKGDVLVRLDDRDATSNLKRAQAKLISVQEAVSQTGKTLERLQNALDSGAVSRKMVEDAEAEWKAAAAEQGVVEEDLRSAKLALERVDVVAPFDGVVAELGAQLGQWLTPPEPALVLLDTSQREVEVAVGLAESSNIHTGQSIVISSSATPDKKWPGEVARVGEGANQQAPKNTTTVYGTVVGEAKNLALGQAVDVEIQASSNERAMKIPIGALIIRNGQRMVAIDRNGHVQFLPVETGLENGTDVEITRGLAIGQKIVIPAGNELVEGQKIRTVGG